MIIYANCGHKLEDTEHIAKYECQWKIRRMDYAENRVRNMVKTGTLCTACKEVDRKAGILLESIEEKEEWLREDVYVPNL